MTALLATGAVVAGVAGALLVYLGAPNQRALGKPLAFRAAMGAGGLAIALSLALLLSVMGIATAIFALIVLLMLVWTLAPFATLGRRTSGKRR